MAKLLSYNCRYLDDICTVNFKYFGDIAKYIYDRTLLLEGSACSYKQDTQGMGQKLEKSCFRCKKNTWHVESNYILQPPKYLIIVVNWFRYINKNFSKDGCSIPMDMTVVLGLHKFSLQATIDQHWPSMYSGHYTASINCCKRTYSCNDSKITKFEMIDTKNSSTAFVVMYKLIA